MMTLHNNYILYAVTYVWDGTVYHTKFALRNDENTTSTLVDFLKLRLDVSDITVENLGVVNVLQ